MGDIARGMICQACNKIMEIEKHVIAEGITENGIKYYTTQPKQTYLIDKNYTPSDELMQKSFADKTLTYIPTFGKFEIEAFIAKELFTSIFVTKNLSNLLNTTISIYDFSCGTLNISSEKIKEIILPLFEVIETRSTYVCTFLEKHVNKK